MPIRFSQLSQLTRGEFGETYHIGAAWVLVLYLVPKSQYYRNMMSVDVTNPRGVLSVAQRGFLERIQVQFQMTVTSHQISLNATNTEISKAGCTEQIIAPAFGTSPDAARRAIRTVFWSFGDNAAPMQHYEERLVGFLAAPVSSVRPAIPQAGDKAVIWIRNTQRPQARDTSRELIMQVIVQLANAANIRQIIFVGDKLPNLGNMPGDPQTYNCTQIHRDPAFRLIAGSDSPAPESNYDFETQLLFFHVLHTQFNAKLAIGMMSGAMDGPAFTGFPTIFFEEHGGMHDATRRMAQAAAAIPNLERVTYPQGTYDASSKTANLHQMPPQTMTALRTAITNLTRGTAAAAGPAQAANKPATSTGGESA